MIITEIDPICALQAAMDGFPVRRMETAIPEADIIVTATGNKDIVQGHHFEAMKDKTIVCNIGHFDNEIDTQFMRNNWKWDEVKPQVHRIFRSDDKNDYLILLSEGRLVNLGNATEHPSRIMDGSFANQVLAQMLLFDAKFADLPLNEKLSNIRVDVLPKKLDEEVAAGMVSGFGGVMTTMTDEQADYIGVSKVGPYKPELYRS